MFDYKGRKPIIISEGLISTTPTSSVKNFIDKWFHFNKRECKIDETTNKIIINLVDINELSEFEYLITLMNNYGWFPSTNIFSYKDGTTKKYNYDSDDINLFFEKKEKLKAFYIEFEAKYDIERTVDIPKLYHVTLEESLNKIKKIGLVPRAKSKISKHPERIYFTDNIEEARKIKSRFETFFKQQGRTNVKFVILEIDNPSEINKFRLYDDPNYKGKGWYSLVNIPPNKIKVVE